ncbi:MAG: YkoF family thiamine/hydroxymethylpyrimidine-binding protein [Limnochordia bacterium]|jgi:uncharacterized protein YqgV (UPF0045/DUF77 family)|nr:YkoF family thiamine/hydroxymethylpyrimidine-binding protein [Bacillota bacterium]
MMISAEVSLYPVEALDSDRVITESLQALNDYQLQYDIGSLSTHIQGEADHVWSALRSLHERALALGDEVVMVVTISNGT